MELASPGNHGTDLALENQRILLQTDLFQRVTQKRVPCISRSEVRVPMGGGGDPRFFFLPTPVGNTSYLQLSQIFLRHENKSDLKLQQHLWGR